MKSQQVFNNQFMNTKVVNARSRLESSVLMGQSNLLLYTILDKCKSRAHVLKDFTMMCVCVCVCVCLCFYARCWWRKDMGDVSVGLKEKAFGLPWWRSGWESACQCRGHGFEPWSGKIPHAAEQLGPWTTTTEPARLEPVLHNKRGHDSERPAHRDEEWPPFAATRESPCTETKTQHSHK